VEVVRLGHGCEPLGRALYPIILSLTYVPIFASIHELAQDIVAHTAWETGRPFEVVAVSKKLHSRVFICLRAPRAGHVQTPI
jgi:hypothetical protein